MEYPLTTESIPSYHLTLALRIRFHVLHTAARASIIDPQQSAECPLCHDAPETIGHYLGACTRMTGIICARHGQAVEIIRAAIKGGTLGDCAMSQTPKRGSAALGTSPGTYHSNPQALTGPSLIFTWSTASPTQHSRP